MYTYRTLKCLTKAERVGSFCDFCWHTAVPQDAYWARERFHGRWKALSLQIGFTAWECVISETSKCDVAEKDKSFFPAHVAINDFSSLCQRFCPPQGWLVFNISGGMRLSQQKNIWDLAVNNLYTDPQQEAILRQNPQDLDIWEQFVYHNWVCLWMFILEE